MRQTSTKFPKCSFSVTSWWKNWKYWPNGVRFCINYARNEFPTKFCRRNDIWDFIWQNINFHLIWPWNILCSLNMVVNSSVKVLSPQYEGPYQPIYFAHHRFACSLFIERKKLIFVAKFFSKIFFGPKVIPNYMSSKVPRSRNQVKLSANKTKEVGRF